MMIKTLKKRYVTLVEMMIVITLIIMIIGVIAWNVQGSLEEGKAFKTKTGMEKLQTILEIMIANNPDLEDRVSEDWPTIIRSSPLVKNVEDISKDGWGVKYEVTVDNGRIHVKSERFQEYLRENPGTIFREQSQN
jgi:general secretion pathway protein G